MTAERAVVYLIGGSWYLNGSCQLDSWRDEHEFTLS